MFQSMFLKGLCSYTECFYRDGERIVGILDSRMLKAIFFLKIYSDRADKFLEVRFMSIPYDDLPW